ncbi:MAG: ABC transporter substrate-binding protein [Anaerolineae bacterium]|uniref:Helical backbone metal receptor n=1 Tax=Thermanaerothrix solaris TaxID=3058434 RepID=A0ABU3NPT3_9CHLR|nr:helical backbone metal receptor [Thermanaerothrix sp. 4228-RoL]MDT8898812.1 helical backbone metal receptor [Thermanaerothrix sp. 4228-RoL]
MTKRRLFCDALGQKVEFLYPPRRVVSLVSGWTEALFAMGCGERVVGVSAYCGRYVPNLNVPVVGDYLHVDESLLHELQPDLILLTTGVQRSLAQNLVRQGWPVFVLPLPNSIYGIWENVIVLGGLMDTVQAARALVARWQAGWMEVAVRAPQPRPRVYAELWFGPHPRTPGALTFIHDAIEIAGGQNIFGTRAAAYLPLDLTAVVAAQPQVWVLFSEPDFPVDAEPLKRERGWDKMLPDLRVIVSTVQRGQNLIHDGPSLLETAAWLQARLREVVA